MDAKKKAIALIEQAKQVLNESNDQRDWEVQYRLSKIVEKLERKQKPAQLAG